MVRQKFKWKFAFVFYLMLLNVLTKSLPIEREKSTSVITSTDSIILKENAYVKIDDLVKENVIVDETYELVKTPGTNETEIEERNTTQSIRSEVRPGQTVTQYSIEITPNGETFSGRAILRVELQSATREFPLVLHAVDLNIASITYGIYSLANPSPLDYWVEDGIVEIFPPDALFLTYMLLIEYTGAITIDGNGLYQGSYESNSYIAMNLHPTNARRVFPCMDEPTEESTISFTFSNLNYNYVVGNSIVESSDGGQVEFTALQGPTHRWGMVAHNFINVNNPVFGARLFARPGVSGQDAQASVIINSVFSRMEIWTMKPYAEIQVGQNEILDIIAMPDIVKDWHSLSTICIWEPHILMSNSHAVTQRKTALIEISKSIAHQWFGYVIYPENWRYQWINTGLAGHSAVEMIRSFLGDALETDNTIVDINAIFVTDFIQEALLRDSYSSALPLEPENDLWTEEEIREHINGLMKYKAPVIMYMLKQLLGPTSDDPTVDYLQAAARALLNIRSLQTFTSLHFYDAVNSDWLNTQNDLLGDMPLQDFMEAWVTTPNYPVINVQLWTAGVTLTQERFTYSNTGQGTYMTPLTFTTSVNPNFDDVTPQLMMENTLLINLFLDEEDWILCNIQGQGYYRVNYDANLWERIILALENPETRDVIHPLNRATLVDDALNLARAGRLDYDIAFRVVLTMEHETDYAVWKAFVRNMEFLRKRLVALVVTDEDEFDQDIYLRMVRRTIGAVENEIGFYPDPLIIEDAMTSMTRGLVMEHACKANYEPCIAAAIDWFYDPNTNDAVNPSIPHDIRPAVYCTMVREGDEDVRNLLLEQYDQEVSQYERLVIVRALACATDQNYLLEVLQESIADDGRFGIEERAEFFKSMIESSYDNADLALRFIRLNANAIKNTFGGSERIEEFVRLFAENAADADLTDSFDIWVHSINSDLDESVDAAMRRVEEARENMIWNDVYMEYVYEWIDENDAQTIVLSLSLLFMSLMLLFMNY